MEFRQWLQDASPGGDMLAAADDVNGAFLFANRAMDTVKESVWVDHGLPFTSDMIHRLAHVQLQRLDTFGDILHEKHLKQSYPPTPGLNEQIEDIDKAFAISVEIVRRVDEALARFIQSAESAGCGAMARSAENLQMQNSADRTTLLQAWQMWDDSRSKTSFDSWVLRMNRKVESEVEEDD